MASQETRNCQNCNQSFVIEPEDFQFYEKMKVPAPMFCPECRFQRRLASRPSGRILYKACCGLCEVEMVSLYPPDSSFPIFCTNCWHGDGWNFFDYGQDYDFSKSFFEQFYELLKRVPREALNMRNSPGSRYCVSTENCKNCYMTIGGYRSIDCMYGEPIMSKNSVDSDFALNTEQAYECFSSDNLYNTKFVFFSNDCIDSSFLYDCKGCNKCFGCMNLRHQKYQIFNKQYSKSDYEKEMEYWDLGSYKKLEEAKARFKEFKLTIPHRFAIATNAVNVQGDDIQNSKNCSHCFLVKHGVENCKYIYYAGLLLKDSYDITAGGETSQLCYESAYIAGSAKSFFINEGHENHDIEYGENITNSSYIFGCVSVKNKQYCILNKQYTKEEYEELREKIIQQMKERPYVDKKGRKYSYGEYFPIEFSVFPYNESWAFSFFRLTKGETLAKGYAWRDREQKVYEPHIETKDLPDHIKNVDASIANKVIRCAHSTNVEQVLCNELCTAAFRIIPEELEFYKKNNMALPRLCPNCRFFQRFSKANFPQLWGRQCVRCSKKLNTSYAPDRNEIIYCQECYNEVFV